jgi:TolB-like protein
MAQTPTVHRQRLAVAALILFLPGLLVVWLVKYANAPAGRLAEASITIRPFQPAGGDDRAAAAITQGITDALSRIPGLRVTQNGTIALEGRVSESGGRLTIAARLVGAQDGGEIWSRRYERAPGGASVVHEEIARDVLNALREHAIAQQR